MWNNIWILFDAVDAAIAHFSHHDAVLHARRHCVDSVSNLRITISVAIAPRSFQFYHQNNCRSYQYKSTQNP